VRKPKLCWETQKISLRWNLPSGTYPESAPDEDLSLAREDGRVTVSGRHLRYDRRAAEVDEARTERTTVTVVITGLATKRTVVVTTERAHLQPPAPDTLTVSGVTTRGEVRQLSQGAKRQGALGALLVDGLFALHYRIQPNF